MRECKHCPDVRRCLAQQMVNSRRRAWLYPFARPECEAGAAPREFAGLTARVSAALASAGRPLTAADILNLLGLSGRDASIAVIHALGNLEKSGRVCVTGMTSNAKNRPLRIWTIADEVRP